MRAMQAGDGRWVRVLSTRDVAKRLGASPSSVRRYVFDGLLRPVRFPGKRLCFLEEELARFLKDIFGIEPIRFPVLTPNDAETAGQHTPVQIACSRRNPK